MIRGEAGEIGREEVNRSLDASLEKLSFGSTEVYFLFGYPRSDIGKGNLIARLASLFIPHSNIIKFDGFLNTNKDARYPSRTHYDFPIYRRFLPYVSFGGSNQIISGMLIQDFLNEYGESGDHLLFRPHVAKYFLLKLYRQWASLGKPRKLFVEVGGTYLDAEVSLFVMPAIALLMRRHHRVRTFLLTEIAYDSDHIKSRGVQRALADALQYGLAFDVVFIRKPKTLPSTKSNNMLQKYIRNRISSSLVYGGATPPIVLIPHYKDAAMRGYRDFVRRKQSQIFGRFPVA